MKYSNKASVYIKKASDELSTYIPDSIHVLGPKEGVPKGTDPSHCIYVVEKMSAKEVANLANSSGVGHVIQAISPHFVQELLLASSMTLKGRDFLSDPTIHILCLPSDKKGKKLVNENKKTWDFNSLEDRTKILTELGQSISSVKQSQHILKSIPKIADELITNALYHNLPMDLQRPNFKNVKFQDDKHASVFFSYTEDRLLIGCRDPYGNLDTDKLVKRIWATYRSEQIQSLNLSDVGAGIGCRMIFNYCTSFYAHVLKGKGAVVAAVLPLGMPNNLSLENSKNLHIVNYGER